MWFPFITSMFTPMGNPFMFANPGTAYARAMFPLAGYGYGTAGYGAGNYVGALGRNLGNSIQRKDAFGTLGALLDLFSVGLTYSAQYRAIDRWNQWTNQLFQPPNITIT